MKNSERCKGALPREKRGVKKKSSIFSSHFCTNAVENLMYVPPWGRAYFSRRFMELARSPVTRAW